MYSNGVCDVVEVLEEIKLIKCKWFYKKKKMIDGKIKTYNVRLVAKCYI